MNETAKFRAKLHTITGNFKASDFADEIPSIHSILQKMGAKCEVILTGWDTTVLNKPQRIYKVGRIYQPAEKYIKVKSVGRRYPVVKAMEPWRDIYPDLFTVPDFGGYKQVVRRNLMDV